MSAPSPARAVKDALIVLVFRTGDVFLGNHRVCLSGLDERIMRQLRVGAKRTAIYASTPARNGAA
jgi:hypothetical protein